MARTCCLLTLLGLFLLATPFSAVYAQTRTTTYKISGLPDTFTGNPTLVDAPCPFEGTGGLEKFGKASAAGVGDADHCPYAQIKKPATIGAGYEDTVEPLAGCQAFYEKMSMQGVSSFETQTEMLKIRFCHLPGPLNKPLPSTARIDAMRDYMAANDIAMAQGAQEARASKTAISGLITAEEKKEMDTAKEAEKQAEKNCLSGTLSNIGAYWAQKGAVSCVMHGSKQVQQAYKSAEEEVKKTIEVCQGHGSDFTIGFSGAPLAIANLIACIINVVVTAANVVTEVKDLSDWINGGCQENVTKAKDVDAFRKSQEQGICQSVKSLIERQFTQCIRIDVGFNLNLPKFKILLQCPFNLNLSYRYQNGGFKCFSSLTSNNAITGHRTLMSGNGGLESLFDGSCFKAASVKSADGNSDFKGLEGIKEGALPGMECGDLSTDADRNQPLKGVKPLQSGFVQNGWVKGPDPAGTETINGVQITRCDFFNMGRRERTAYVYGNGSSCSDSATNAFKDSAGKETNTACYTTGGYAPAEQPAVPQACLYPRACLDNAGNFASANLGTQGCPADTQPSFCGGKAGAACPGFEELGCTGANCPERTSYKVTTSGVGATEEWRECKGLDSATFDPAPICCDPHKQNCVETQNDARRAGKPEIPLCKCSEGDANNKPDPNKKDGSCMQGGYATCCAPSLNKVMDASGNVLKDAAGKELDGCTTAKNLQGTFNAGGLGLPDSARCASDVPSCIGGNVCGDYKGPDGKIIKGELCAGNISLSKPSPYLFLFVRPDMSINNVQCCMTKWCNICPQHYANAYGLSLTLNNHGRAGSANNVARPAWGGYDQSNYDKHNNDLLGKGWPFEAVTDTFGFTSYEVRTTPLNPPFIFDHSGFKFGVTKPEQLILAYSQELEEQWLEKAITACNDLPYPAKRWQTRPTPKDMFPSSPDYGFGFIPDRDDYFAMIPEPKEYPLEYLNRVTSGASGGSTIMGISVPNVPEFRLCSEVIKVCEPDPNDNPLTTGGGLDSGNSNPAPIPTDPDPTTGCNGNSSARCAEPTPAPSGGSSGGGDGGSTNAQMRSAAPPAAVESNTTSGPTAVPSVKSNNSSINQLY